MLNEAISPLMDDIPLNRRDFLKLAGAGLSSLLLASSGLGSFAKAFETSKAPIKKGLVESPQMGIAKSFPLIENGIEGLSAKQVQAHLKLYEGYVKKYQAIRTELHGFNAEELTTVNATYHPFRELLIEESFALNGVLLHEEYFGILTPNPKPMSANLESLLKTHFNSMEAFKAQLMASAKAMRGWAILAYCPRYKHLSFYGLDTHNTFAPMGVHPILVVDVYEHAYMIDYSTNRGAYLEALWKQIDWTIVEARLSFI